MSKLEKYVYNKEEIFIIFYKSYSELKKCWSLSKMFVLCL